MADTTTTNYAFTQPEPGVTGWDAKLNNSLEAIDGEIKNRENEVVAMGNSFLGRNTIWIPANAMEPSIVGGAYFSDIALGGGFPDIHVLSFDPAVGRNTQFGFAMPKQWNKGDFQYQVFWTGDVAEVNDVMWQLLGTAFANGDLLATSWSGAGAALITDTSTGVINDLKVSAISGFMTINGNPGNDEMCFFRLARVGADTGDTYTGVANLLGIKLFFDINAGNDA